MSLPPITGPKTDLPERPLTPPVPEEAEGAGAYAGDYFVPSRTLAGQGARDKAWIGVRTAGLMVPEAVEQMWLQRRAIAKSVLDAYLHPVQSFQQANQAYAQALGEDRMEATLTALKNHAGLLSAWSLPLAAGLTASTTIGPVVAATGVALGTVSVGATVASLVKNIYDASQATSGAELAAQSEQILADGVGLGLSAATTAAATGLQGSVRVAAGKSFKGGPSLPAPSVNAPGLTEQPGGE